MAASALRPWYALSVIVVLAATVVCDRSEQTTKRSNNTTPESLPTGDPPDLREPAWKTKTRAWKPSAPIPNYTLVDHNGHDFELRELSDSYVLVGFIFTRCAVPEACPATMKLMRRTQELWSQGNDGKAATEQTLKLLSLTLDPENDTPEQLKRFGETYEADLSSWILASGPTGLMDNDLPSIFGVLAVAGRDSQITHTVKVALLAPGLVHIADWEDNQVEPAAIIKLIDDHAAGATHQGDPGRSRSIELKAKDHAADK